MAGASTTAIAYQIDFARQVRKGDSWTLIVERKITPQQVIQSENILLAKYSRTIWPEESGTLYWLSSEAD